MILLSIAFHALGVLFAILAIWRSRTPQGAVAWAVTLLTVPYVAVPLFFIFGRSKFSGYVKTRKEFDQLAREEMAEVDAFFKKNVHNGEVVETLSLLAMQAHQPGFTKNNKIDLLIDAEAAYPAMLDAIEAAQEYILFQFYIFRPDSAGMKFIEALMRKARQGVRVYFMCDKIGTRLKSSLIRELEAAGIEVNIFYSTKKWHSLFQINFRNHRKVVVVDGKVSFIGGINIGDDYLGLRKNIGPWRDTHVCLEGPSALAAQFSFLKDWHWTSGRVLDLHWREQDLRTESKVLVLHTGPSDEHEACLLTYLDLVNAAQERVWIANPYFVPPQSMQDALILACARGLDVRILAPSYSDNPLLQLASLVYLEKLKKAGARIFQYLPGFLHQKVMLLDRMGVVGSANIDARSFYLNFEITAISDDVKFRQQLEQMLLKDLEHSKEVTLDDFAKRPIYSRFASRTINLMAPVL